MLLNSQPIVSFIIPAYNAEKTIVPCIKSILEIEKYDIQIIVINDGSKDKTVEICENIKDKRVCVISQENQGVSSARNRGIVEAAGRFIMFVDADDLICADELEKILKNIDETDELIMFSVLRNIKGTVSEEPLPMVSGIYNVSGLDYLKERVLDVPLYKKWENSVLQGSACRYLFRRKSVLDKKIFFNKKLSYSEDLCFCLEVYSKFRKLKIADYKVYIINVNENSASRSYRENFWEELQEVYKEITAILGEERSMLYYHYGKSSINHYVCYTGFQQSIRKIRVILSDSEFKKALTSIKFEKKTLSERFEDFSYLHRMTYVLVIYKKINYGILKIGSYVKKMLKR